MCITWDGETDHNTCDPSVATPRYRIKTISFPCWYTGKIECNFTLTPHFWNKHRGKQSPSHPPGLISNKTTFNALTNLPRCSGIANKFQADFFTTIRRYKFCAACVQRL